MKLSIIPLLMAVGVFVAGVQVVNAEDPVDPPVPPLPVEHTVEPGECHTNDDGVEVCNDADSEDDMTVTPKSGSESSDTTVVVESDAEGTVKGIDGGDTVEIQHNGGPVTVEGTGGTVDVTAGGVMAMVTNTNPAGGGGASITVQLAGGTVSVPPGSTVNIP